MNLRKLRFIAGLAIPALSPAGAHAEILNLYVDQGMQFLPVTYKIDISIPGVLSAAGGSHYADFAIIGGGILQVGDATVINSFSVGGDDENAFLNRNTIYETTSEFFDGVDLYLHAYPGEGVGGSGFSTIRISALPEPSSWAMMLIGFGGLAFAAWRKVSALSPSSNRSCAATDGRI